MPSRASSSAVALLATVPAGCSCHPGVPIAGELRADLEDREHPAHVDDAERPIAAEHRDAALATAPERSSTRRLIIARLRARLVAWWCHGYFGPAGVPRRVYQEAPRAVTRQVTK
jgi:hypothetical protein